jgi:hypothetical protein
MAQNPVNPAHPSFVTLGIIPKDATIASIKATKTLYIANYTVYNRLFLAKLFFNQIAKPILLVVWLKL